MQFWLPVVGVAIDQVLEVARCAERRGYAGVTLADHVIVPVEYRSRHPSGDTPFDHRAEFPDPLTTIAAMAAVTTRLRFLTYVYVATMREPFSLAKQAGTVAQLSQGRFALGIGAGWLLEEIELLGFDAHSRGRRMDEMIEVMRRFWREGVVEFHGEFYDFAPVGMFPQPRREAPIWIGGKSTAALRRAARNDGWVGMNYDLDEIPGLLDQLRNERTRADAEARARTPFETLVTANAAPGAELYAHLESMGVTSTVALAWPFGDPAYSPLERKLDAIEAFADRYLPGVQ
jgi:probable F420-dependent oxidoreductase